MSLDIDERREYRQDGFVYLLDDEEKTAWIKQGRIKRCHRYRLPDYVMIEGERYTVESVEAGAYNRPRTLRHLVIPDSIHYVDEDAFYCQNNLRSVFIGKSVEYLDNFNSILHPQNMHFCIDKDNPYLKYLDGIILSKDGKKVLACPKDRQHVTIPEGVEEINHYAFSGFSKLETISLPRTLRRTRDNSLSCLPKLRSVVLPEGFEICGTQCFMENKNLTYVDLPSTITDLGWETFMDCSNLQTIVLRMPKVIEKVMGCFEGVPTDTCRLYVPADLVEQYRQHPVWGVFQHIFPIEKYANYEIPFQALSDHDEVFDLNQIPMEVLDKGWKRYHPYLLIGDELHPLSFGRPVVGDTTLAVLQNIKKLIVNTFEIDEKQFVIMNDYQGLSASILIALCDDNVEVMEAAMQTQWYFKEDSTWDQLLEDRKGRRWMNVRFKKADRERIRPAYDYLYYLYEKK